MIVDDEPGTLQIFEVYLKSASFEVDAFSEPVKALESFTRNPNLYSLLVTDVRMPVMSGIGLAKRVLRIRPDIKILLMTAFQMDQSEIQDTLPAEQFGDILLRKPFDLDQMLDAIKKQLQPA
jgi:DNA-binding NtrC family response regulator